MPHASGARASGGTGGEEDPRRRSTILELVQNKNNMAENLLRKRLAKYQRQLDLTILKMDNDRLDVFDFLKKVKLCQSNKMAEFAQ